MIFAGVTLIRLYTLGGTDLRGADDQVVRSVLAQPKRFALLVYLAAATPRGMHRRDVLLPLFWPELDQPHARAALRKAIHFLRHAVDPRALLSRGEEEIGIAEGLLWCDVVAFEEALVRNRLTDAMELYRGDLLAGFHVEKCAEFDHWLDETRERYRRHAVAAAASLSRDAEGGGDSEEALRWARRSLQMSLGDELALRRLLELQDRLGDRVGAMQEFERYRHRLSAEHGWIPSPETVALVRAIGLREAAGATAAKRQAPDPAWQPQVGPTPEASPTEFPATEPGLPSRWPAQRRYRRWIAGIALGLVVGAAVLVFSIRSPAPHNEPLVVAVGLISDFAAQDLTIATADAVADMLSTNLSRIRELRVLSNGRVHEVFGQSGEAQRSASALARSARLAGATRLVEGGLYQRSDGSLRFDLRLLDLSTGAVLGAWTVAGSDRFAVVDSATALLAQEVGTPAPGLAIADVMTSSLVAYRFYTQGLRNFYEQGDPRTALRFFSEALAEDSGFAMAAYYASQAAAHLDLQEYWSLMEQAVAASARAGDRDRLRILGTWRYMWDDPGALPVAESLAFLYPDEADGHLLQGHIRMHMGDVVEAIDHYRSVIAKDSLSMSRPGTRCLACDALAYTANAYVAADSLVAAERVAREYLRRLPNSAGGWSLLVNVLDSQHRYEEAKGALREADRLSPLGEREMGRRRALLAIRAGDLGVADSLLSVLVSADPRPESMLWYRVIVLRYQGRLREAHLDAQRSRDLSRGRSTALEEAVAALPEATVLFEMGQSREAAARYEAILRAGPGEFWMRGGKVARHRAWWTTLLASALAAAGDTARLDALADTIEAVGPGSLFGRDRLLHHHVRGLLALARGDSAEAEDQFARALWSSVAGYTRTNFQLGRLLVARERAAEAIPILRAALRGGLEGPQLYITHTEIREQLGRVFEQVGESDSAAVHYRWVAGAWADADPQFDTRRADVDRRLARLEANGP